MRTGLLPSILHGSVGLPVLLALGLPAVAAPVAGFAALPQDTVVVRSGPTGRLGEAHLVEVTRIGRVDGDLEWLLSGWILFAVGHRGEVYVSDDQGIRVFSPDGMSVRSLARKGQGPGEVGNVMGIEVALDGRLVVTDLSNARALVMDTSGIGVRHWRLPGGRHRLGGSPVMPTPGDSAVVAFTPYSVEETPGGRRPAFTVHDPEGAVARRIDLQRPDGCLADDPDFVAGMWSDLREPVFPKLKWAAAPDGSILSGCPVVYSFDVLRPDGSVLRIEKDGPPLIVSDDEREAWVDSWDAAWQRAGRDRRWHGPAPPRQKPAYHEFYPGRDGSVWVWPSQPSEAPEHPQAIRWVEPPTGAFDVFDPDGRYRGAVHLPDDATFVWYRPHGRPVAVADTVWLLRSDDLDRAYVGRMRVVWR